MDMEIFHKLAEEFPGLEFLEIAGFGENFCHQHILEILDRLGGSGIRTHIVTNGLVIKGDIADSVVRNKIERLSISVDAATEETYQNIRRGGKLQDLISNIQYINQLKRLYHQKTPYLILTFIGMKQNIHEFPAFIELCQQLEVDTMMLQGLNEHDPVKGDSLLWHKDVSIKYYHEGKALADKYGIFIDLFPPDQFQEEAQIVPEEGISQVSLSQKGADPQPQGAHHDNEDSAVVQWRKKCQDPWTRTFITHSGEVRSCCAGYTLGNLHENPFPDIWQGERYNRLRSQIISKSPPGKCRVCPGRGWYQARAVTDQWYADDPNSSQLGHGWLPEEQIDKSFRWTQEKATLFLRNTNKRYLIMEMHGFKGRCAALFRKWVRGHILVNDLPMGKFWLFWRHWKKLKFSLPKLDSPVLKVDIVVEQTFRAMDYPFGKFPHQVGIALHRAGLED
jgi:MoaA/NifB/PqqE/SkfB family radical SAM enzyme